MPTYQSLYHITEKIQMLLCIDIKMGKTCNFLAMPNRWRSQCLEVGNFSDLPSIDGRYLPMAKGFQQSVTALVAEDRGRLNQPNAKL